MAAKNPTTIVFHYNCKRCRVIVAQDGNQWVGQGGGTNCELRHLPNGEFLNGTRNTTCRYCGQYLKWAENSWQVARPPYSKTCNFQHQV